jgi:predicted nuclease with TOPRIM domain
MDVKKLKAENAELKESNRKIHNLNNRLIYKIRDLEAHIELLKAEIIVLQKRNEKSKKLHQILEPPSKKQVKSFEIDNRNTQSHD